MKYKHYIKFLVLASCVFHGYSVAEDQNNISPDYGIGYYEYTPDNSSSSERGDIVSVVKEYYGLTDPKIYIKGFNKISAKKYVVYAYIDVSKGALDRMSSKASKGSYVDDWGNQQVITPQNIFLMIVDTKTREIYRLDREDNKVFSSLLMSSGGRYSSNSIDVYGCAQGYPTTLADINGDDVKDLIFIGGSGSLYLPDEQISADTRLVIFLGENYDTELLAIKLHEEDFNFYFAESGNVFQVVRDQLNQRIKGVGKPEDFIVGTPENLRPGYRNFAKVYFKDFDNDGIYSILVWRRYYLSRKKSDPVKGFEFDREEFELYDIAGNSARKIDTDVEQGHALLTGNNLRWQDGFPQKSMCGGVEGYYPLIVDYDHPELAIDDPVVQAEKGQK